MCMSASGAALLFNNYEQTLFKTGIICWIQNNRSKTSVKVVSFKMLNSYNSISYELHKYAYMH